ncbi:MAG: B12-binding domain-containing radical SAM protein [Planctomycetota bacterium]|jgi:hypothetical protein
MQVNLVFSPFAMLSLPLGIAGIKAYAEKNSDFRVKCFDLNAMYHNILYDAVQDRTFNKLNKIGISFDEGVCRTFLRGVGVLKTRNDGFFNQAIYKTSIITFTSFFNKLTSVFHEACYKALDNDGPIAWFVQQQVDILLSNKPDVVGFSVMFAKQYYFSLLAARMLKAANKNICIVFGGCLPTEIYKHVLINATVDFVVLNEGEKTFLDLLNALDGDRQFDKISNLAFRKNGKPAVTEPSMIKELDHIPFADFSDFDPDSYFAPEAVIPVLGSRGCYWRRCTFCTHHKSYFNKYRQASVKHVVDELEQHLNNGVKYFSFVDEMISSARFKQIGEEIIRRKLQLYYYALAKPTGDFTQEAFDIMYQSGCRYIIWGVESGCQRILDLIDKGTVVKDVSRVLADSASAGIKNHVYIIIGFPSETKQEFTETLDFLYENRDNIHTVHKGAFSLARGSLVYENPSKFCITNVHPSQNPTESIKYDVSQGIKNSEAREYAKFYTISYFNHFTDFSVFLGIFRNHALCIYSNPDKVIFNLKKVPVPPPAEIVGVEV